MQTVRISKSRPERWTKPIVNTQPYGARWGIKGTFLEWKEAGGGNLQSGAEQDATASSDETDRDGSQAEASYWGPCSTIDGFPKEQDKEQNEEEKPDCKNRYKNSRGQLSHQTLVFLRYRIPQFSPYEITPEGRAGVKKLQGRDILIDEQREAEMSKGMGGGDKIRSEVGGKIRQAEDNPIMAIRIARRESMRTRRNERRY